MAGEMVELNERVYVDETHTLAFYGDNVGDAQARYLLGGPGHQISKAQADQLGLSGDVLRDPTPVEQILVEQEARNRAYGLETARTIVVPAPVMTAPETVRRTINSETGEPINETVGESVPPGAPAASGSAGASTPAGGPNPEARNIGNKEVTQDDPSTVDTNEASVKEKPEAENKARTGPSERK
jgi:hypothetical protein